jgi:hypothetical protein
MPQAETYFDHAIGETEESIRDAEREVERLRRVARLADPPLPETG